MDRHTLAFDLAHLAGGDDFGLLDLDFVVIQLANASNLSEVSLEFKLWWEARVYLRGPRQC